MEEQIKTTYYKAWTDLIEQELNDNKFDLVCKLHREIVIRICRCIPSRSDLHDQIAEKMDPVLFKQQLENKVYTGEDFLNMVQYVYTWIKNLSSPARDKDIENSLNELLQHMNDGGTFGKLVPEFILHVHRHLDDLETDLGRDVTKKFKEFVKEKLNSQ